MTTITQRLCQSLPIAAALVVSPLAAEAPLSAVKLVPHRAVYEIRLGETRQGTAVTEIGGRMVFEITGSDCEGYTQNMRFVLQMSNRDGSTTLTDMRSSSWEDAQARRYRFNVSNYKDQVLEDATNGTAVIEENKDGIRIDLQKPRKAEVKIDGRIVFPVLHSRMLIAAAREKKSSLEIDIYDGSDKGEKVYATSALIGKERKGVGSEASSIKNADQLKDLASWPMTISYFDKSKDKTDVLPVYEISFLFLENGVSDNLLIDYGEFSIKGRMTSIELYEPSKCEAPKQ
ncbi:MAG: cell envelope integrity EipB family protein [Hyphomicrobiaceae bacterium]|nr:MAG: cell envelope integrity EipB family protein [Hyphomicrobiaceae bacterium]